MDALLEVLDSKFREWNLETADHVRRSVAELIELADHHLLDVTRSRSVEQEVLDLVDSPQAH